MVINLGTQDLSKKTVNREAEAVPQHCPKFYLYTRKGPETPQLVSGAERTLMFGEESFDYRGPYANHATAFANVVNEIGNACMIQRIIPDDAGPQANFLLWLDVLPCPVSIYERNTDGSIKLVNSAPVVVETAPGYKVKWVLTHYNTKSALSNGFGKATITAGDQTYTGGATPVQSQRYPIYGFKSAFVGAYGNLCGIRLWASTKLTSNAMPIRMMADKRAYPFNVSMIRQATPNTSPSIVPTLMNDQYVMVVAKPDVVDPSTQKQIFIGDTLLDSYQNTSDMNYPPLYGDFSTMEIYQNNIDLLISLFHTAEIPYITTWSDFTALEADRYLFNFISGLSSEGVSYQTYQFVDAANAIRLTEFTNIFASGGSDGTMNDANFAISVGTELERYLDPSDPLQEDAVNVESIFYDSGFPLATKYKAISFIALRKDTFLSLSTHDVNDRIMDSSEEHSIAIALRTRLQMYPESSYFTTGVVRAIINGECGNIRDSLYKKLVPVTYELAAKCSEYMGAGNGRWTQDKSFDIAPNHIIQRMHNISNTWVPATVRNRNWDVGLNWIQRYDRQRFFFPAFKTVYSDDTSVLNSMFTALAICQLVKIANAAWREYSGVSGLTNDQLIERVNNFVKRRTTGRFDNRFVITPNTVITTADEQRGFSFTLIVKIFSPSMKTVLTTYIEAHRLDDLVTA